MTRFSASQHLRFRIRELWETKGSKMDFEEFYQIKMEQITKMVSEEIFRFQNHGLERIGTVEMYPAIDHSDPTIAMIDKIFGIEQIE